MKKLLLTIFLLHSLFSTAQNRITDRNNIGWYAANATFTVSEHFGIHTEYQWRRLDYGENWQQGLLRIGVNYKYNNNVLFRAGYAWAETYPYGEIPLNGMGKDFTEHRIFEMVQFNNNMNQLNVSHRLMLEQRWVGRYSSEDLNNEDIYIYTNRLRYMFRLQLPVYKDFYAAAYDEIFIGFGGKIAENIFDQNRLGLLVGYQFNKHFKAEGGYLNQIVQLGREVNGENVFQKNNGFIVTGIFNFDLRKAATGK
ncbi:DUF2490 domain-containing protein [Flavobacterium lotistagni]|uniref:DUF2490 domain-containing protein n=1 Tax=Flavobacterium lotistagni TaxID=2709660 RepID=UPI001A9CAF43|nr:DUF2490 domain-containing protein [Flavobacterium lotistagni]